jgi:hypothetical protein
VHDQVRLIQDSHIRDYGGSCGFRLLPCLVLFERERVSCVSLFPISRPISNQISLWVVHI